MPGFDTDSVGGGGTLYATNVDFTGSSFTSGSPQMVSNGQLLIGASTNPRIRVNTLTAGTGVSIVNGPGTITVAVTGSGVGQTITGNSGGALSPTAGNWNIFGASTAAGTTPVTTSGSGSTLTVNVQTSQALAAADATKIGLANFDSSAFSVAATGFVTLSTTGVLRTLTGNSGGAISPTAGNINTLGTGSITIAGSGSTLTTQLTGLTNHAIQIGAGTATLTQLSPGTTGQVLQTNTGGDPTWSTPTYPSASGGAGVILRSDGTNNVYTTATYPSTSTINQLLYSSSNNVIAGLATANNGVLTTGTTGIPVITALASNGQLIIGSGSGAPAAAVLTPGAGITITNAANSITIANTNPSGFPWTDVTTATQTLAVNNGYVTDHANVTYTLPSTAALGDTIKIVGKVGIATVAQNANQQIMMGTADSTVGATGSIAGTDEADCVELICVTAGASTLWTASNWVGNWTIT